MSRTSKLGTMRRCLLSTLTAATLLAGLLPTAAQAAGYVFQQHVLNAGVLVNGSDPAPYLFYVMNSRPDVRPTDLTLVNPLASATAQQNTAAYWEVQLNSVSDAQLAEYNVLYLRADNVSFGPAINERLRRFVDNGGQLIVEYGTSSTPAAHGLFVGTSPTSPAAGAGTVGWPVIVTGGPVLKHPIISQPYLLSGQDLLDFGSIGNTITPNTEALNNLFSPVLTLSSGTNPNEAVFAAQIGAGQVVVSALNLGTGISVGNAAGYVQTDLYKANTSDLKLLANILTWSETHPNENKSSHGNASGIGLASFTPAWQFPVSATTPAAPASSAAVWGNFVFVTDAYGVLRAFDAFPSENLIGGATTDDGLTDYSTGTAYDQIWSQSAGSGASAPTVAAFKGVNYVFVEKPDGSVLAFNAVTGASYTLPSAPAALTGYTAVSYPVAGANAPAPTYYDGRVYAAQGDGTLNVYDLNENTCVQVPLDPTTTVGEFVTGSPAVGTLANGDTNVLVAVVPTNYNIYSVLLGARNEPLSTFNVNNAVAGYSIARQRRYDVTNLFADLNAVPPLLAYDYTGNINATPPNNTAPNPQDPLFPIVSNIGYYTDWDMDFAAAVGTGTPSPVDLNYISADSYSYINQNATPVTTVSAAAVDRLGDYYYTQTDGTNSYLVGVQNALLFSGVHLKFRFLLPSATGLSDADGVDYSPLTGFQFVGAPVVDDLDNVYVAATKPNPGGASQATVLCFRGDQQISTVLPSGTALDLTQVAIDQGTDNPITKGVTSDSYGGQYTASGLPANSIDFYNFASSVRRNGIEILGNLTEPQPVNATDQTTVGAGPITMKMRTNLAWFVDPSTFTTTGAITGLSRVGSSLFLTDGTNLYRLPTTPQIGAGKIVSSTTLQPVPSITPLNPNPSINGVGAVGAAPSIGGNVMVINGKTGIAALTRQVTIIADNNRILGVDGDGGAVWSVDATTRTDLSSGVSTKVSLAHPTSLSQFALNDYLVADTGNDRCVRFDSGGNVQWELTRFTDPNGLMAPGQPLTLSQPSSVVTRTDAFTAGPYAGDIGTFYLIADSGNNRVLEVADIVTPAGAAVADHVLTWVSHTADQSNRQYRYGCAAYYDNPSPPVGYSTQSIAATVTNTRLGPLTATGPGPVSSDAAGGSIVVFNRPLTQNAFSAGPVNDLAYTTSVFYSQALNPVTGVITTTPYTITHPRFLQLYTPLAGGSPQIGNAPNFDFLYADDNGTFDLTYVVSGTKSGFVAGPDRLQFTPSDYQNMQYQSQFVPAFGVSDITTNTTTGATSYANINLRSGLPFIPTCVQGLNTASQPSGANTLTTRRYLITQNYSQGELGSISTTTAGLGANATTTGTGKLGGEVFEVDVTVTSTTSTGAVTSATQTPVGGFAGGETLSHPALTGPLTQPTFGVRLP